MHTIVIKVGKDRPEDDILGLVENLKTLIPVEVVNLFDALVIETESEAIAAVLKKINGATVPGKNGDGKKFECVKCGAPVAKRDGMCKSCGSKMAAMKKRKALQGDEVEEA